MQQHADRFMGGNVIRQMLDKTGLTDRQPLRRFPERLTAARTADNAALFVEVEESNPAVMVAVQIFHRFGNPVLFVGMDKIDLFQMIADVVETDKRNIFHVGKFVSDFFQIIE